MTPASLLAVVYVKDLSRTSRFYERVLGLARAEESADFVSLVGPSLEITFVRIPERIADGITIADPPTPREDTPIKLSFLVVDIEATRSPIVEMGGQLKPASATWSSRGCRHLDGVDPEGNVFQLRQLVG